jgi:hypothetical protein
VQSKRKPVRIGIGLNSKISSGIITLRIAPVQNRGRHRILALVFCRGALHFSGD